MDTWDQTKLEEVVLNKHGNPRTTTDIVCKYFLDAIENQKYGWFWECPNGGENVLLSSFKEFCNIDRTLPTIEPIELLFLLKIGTECKYRHALPPGFVLKSLKKKEDDKEEISIEDFLEVEVRESHWLATNVWKLM